MKTTLHLRHLYVFLLFLIVTGQNHHAQTKYQLLTSEVTLEEVERFVLQQMDSLKIPAVSMAFIDNGHIIYQNVLGVKNYKTKEPIEKTSLFDAASLTKTLFAYQVLKTVDKGLLDLDRPLYTYSAHPDLEHDERHKLITARMILSHTSGLPNWRFFNADGKLDIKFMPGTRFQYSGEGYEYLAQIIAMLNDTSKDNLDLVVKKEVFEPLQMGQSHMVWNEEVDQHRIEGHINGKMGQGWGISPEKPGFYASYSLQTQAKDYARLLIAIMEGQGISKSAQNEMLGIQITSGIDKRMWGLGIEIIKEKDRYLHMHDGFNNNFSSGYLFDKDSKDGYVFFANSDTGYKLNDIFRNYFFQ